MLGMWGAPGPMYTRSSAINALAFERGKELGIPPEKLAAAQANLSSWLMVLWPMRASRLYGSFGHLLKGAPYIASAGMVVLAQVLLLGNAPLYLPYISQ